MRAGGLQNLLDRSAACREGRYPPAPGASQLDEIGILIRQQVFRQEIA